MIDLKKYSRSGSPEEIEISDQLRKELTNAFQKMAKDIYLDELLWSDRIGDELTYLKGYIKAITDASILFDDADIHKDYKK